MKKVKGRPKDSIQLAKLMMEITTGQVEDTVTPQKKKKSDAEYAKAAKKKK